jgi:hypothetical protein
MMRLARTTIALAALLLLAAPAADARGGRGAGIGGGMGGRRGGSNREGRWNAQSYLLVSDCVREENVRRLRHVDW